MDHEPNSKRTSEQLITAPGSTGSPRPSLTTSTDPLENDEKLLARRSDSACTYSFGFLTAITGAISFRSNNIPLVGPAIASAVIVIAAIALLCINKPNDPRRHLPGGKDFAIGLIGGTVALWSMLLLLNNLTEQDAEHDDTQSPHQTRRP
jgi:hypothetical protein